VGFEVLMLCRLYIKIVLNFEVYCAKKPIVEEKAQAPCEGAWEIRSKIR